MNLPVRALLAVMLPILFVCLSRCVADGTRQRGEGWRNRQGRSRQSEPAWQDVEESDGYHAATRIIYQDPSVESEEPARPRHRHRSRTAPEQDSQEQSYPSNCSSCRIREEVKKLRIETVKAQILSKLRLKAPPNITNRNMPRIPSLSRWMDEFEMQSDQGYLRVDQDNEDDFYAKTTKIINFAIMPPPRLQTNMSNLCFFELEPQVTRSHILSANLSIYFKPPVNQNPNGPEATTLLLIYRLTPPTEEGRPPNKTLIKQKKIDLNTYTGGWKTLKIRSAIHHWINHPERNYGLLVHFFDHNGNSLVITPSPNNTAEENLYKPFVEFGIRERGSSRVKRNSQGLVCKEGSPEERCCKHPLTVDFDEFQWDWIIVPRRYRADYCSGECPFVFLSKYPHTHFVQQQSNLTAGPCCTPTKMSPLSLLVRKSESEIMYGVLPGMVVDRCGCV